MSNDKAVSDHYTQGDLLETLRAALAGLGKTADNVTIEDLAPVDEFHIGGRQATEHFIGQLNFAGRDHILDVGCGLGGASRFVASKYNSRVSGIDLTPEYIETGKVLSAWVGLDKQVALHQGSALSLPFQDAFFDGGFMMHVGMNIEDKVRLFAEVHRVLRPGAFFGVYDVMRISDGELSYPVPWATGSSTSSLAAPAYYRQALHKAGFKVTAENNRYDFTMTFFNELQAKMEAGGSPPPLGLHTLMGENTPQKIQNMIRNISAGYIAPVEIIARKHGDRPAAG